MVPWQETIISPPPSHTKKLAHTRRSKIGLHFKGYYIVLCDCQTSDMVRIGFLSRVRPFIWREDIKTIIQSTALWQSDPFQFRLFPGSLSCHKKSLMCPVLMVETERDKIAEGLEFFCHAFDGENPLSPCGIAYPFFTLYQNQLTDEDRLSIIQDSLHHTGEVSLIHLHGLQDVNNLVSLRQNIQVQLRKLLLGIRANLSNHQLFIQVEKEADRESIVCAYHSVDNAVVMANIPFLSQYIRAYLLEKDYDKAFLYQDFSITPLTKTIPIKAGNMQVNSKPIPFEVQEHTSNTLQKMVSPPQKRAQSPSLSQTTPSTLSSSKSFNYCNQPSTKLHPSDSISSPNSETEQRLRTIETRLDNSTARMDNIEDLCRQLKNSTDMISSQLSQLSSDLISTRWR